MRFFGVEFLPCKTHQTEQLNNDWIPCKAAHIPERRILTEKRSLQSKIKQNCFFLSSFIFRSALLLFKKTESCYSGGLHASVLVRV